jgi:hypothetical protein
VNPRKHISSARLSTSRENHTVTMLSRIATHITPLRKFGFTFFSPISTQAERGDPATRAAAMASVAAGDARTQGAPIAALSARLRTWQRAACAAAGVVAVLGGGAFLTATPANAATGAPQWAITSLATPTDFTAAANPVPGSECAEDSGRIEGLNSSSCDLYNVAATNVGAAPMKAKEVTLEDTLPPGLSVSHVDLSWIGIQAVSGHGNQENLNASGKLCTISLPLVKCTLSASFFTALGHTLQPDDSLIMTVSVSVTSPVASGPLSNRVVVQGGGALGAEASPHNTLEEGIPPFGPTLFDSPALASEGTPSTQAGSHPYELPTTLGLASAIRVDGEDSSVATSVEDPADILIDLPPGLAGSAISTPALCTFAELSAPGPAPTGSNNTSTACPKESQIGHLTTFPIGNSSVIAPLFNMVPERGVAAEFGYFDSSGSVHTLYVSLVPGPEGYVLRTSSRGIAQIALNQIVANVYGDPATRDHSILEPAKHVPTLTMPADCSGRPLITTVHTDSWQRPGTYLPDGEPNFSDPHWTTASSEAPPVTGCNQLEGLFEPTISAVSSTNRADSPTGLEVDLKVPQTEGTETLGTPPLKKAVVTLPAGMTVNPSSANGLQGCSLAALGMSASGQPDAAPPHCPDASKIGTVELKTPALEGDPKFAGFLQGQIYVAKQSENPFHNLLAIYIVVDDPYTGVIVKLPGEIRADQTTGQLETVVDNSPQFPFSELRTKFFSGQRAALRTPSVCGKYEVTSQLTPWSAPESGPPAEPSASFEITQGCASSAATEPNHPAFTAGTLDPLAGAYSPFVLKLGREDGSQELSGLSVTLPPGLIGKLAGIAECPEAGLALARSREHEGGGAEELAAPACPASSEVGSVTVGAGAGLTPYYAQGHAYLAGPYKGAPLSLAIITPAVAGPYDLGDVLVRTALQVDPYTTQITAVSDPIPHILHGIPLDVRSIALSMNRSQFILNPTNCEKKAVTGSAATVLGQSAPLSNPFQVGGCKNLGFHPNLALKLKGGTKRNQDPALSATLTYPKGSYANIASAQVTLPHSAFLKQEHIKTVCTQPQLASRSCPAGSIYGSATATSPLLDQPLTGPVYLGVGFGHKLPDLVAELNGQIRVLLHGKVDTGREAGLRNSFEVVPDAPVTKFTLNLDGGKKGLIVNSENLCGPRAKVKALAKFTAQNGKVYEAEPVVANSCGGKSKKGKKAQKSRAAFRSSLLPRPLGEW